MKCVFHKKKTPGKIFKRILIALLCVIPLMPFLYVFHNQARKKGISFASLPELYTVNCFLSAVKQENYEKAFSYLNISNQYEQNTRFENTQDFTNNYLPSTIDGADYYIIPKVYKKQYTDYLHTDDNIRFWYELMMDGNYLIPEDIFLLFYHATELYIQEPFKDFQFLDGNHKPVILIQIDGKNYYTDLTAQQTADGRSLLENEEVYTDPTQIRFKLSSEEYSDLSSYLTQQRKDIKPDILINAGVSLIPISVYESVLESRQEKADRINAIASYYKDMGYDNYIHSMKETFIHNMGQLKDSGYQLTDFKLENITKSDSSYQINYNLYFTKDGNRSSGYGLMFSVNNSKLWINGSISPANGYKSSPADFFFISLPIPDIP